MGGGKCGWGKAHWSRSPQDIGRQPDTSLSPDGSFQLLDGFKPPRIAPSREPAQQNREASPSGADDDVPFTLALATPAELFA